MMMGAGFAIARAIKEDGLAEYFAEKISYAATHLNCLPFLFIMMGLISALTETASNTALASILFPVLVTTAEAADFHPLVLLIVG